MPTSSTIAVCLATCLPSHCSIALVFHPIHAALLHNVNRPIFAHDLIFTLGLQRLLALRRSDGSLTLVEFRLAELRLPRFRSPISEHLFNFFQALAACLWIRDEELNSCTETKYTEYDKGLPRYVFEGWWDEQAEGKVWCWVSDDDFGVVVPLCDISLNIQLPVAAIPMP